MPSLPAPLAAAAALVPSLDVVVAGAVPGLALDAWADGKQGL
ncbi:hypothetical protein [Actinomycetospora aeridis]|uniref:Uncharacterized protein n=1 Tax=Actinomycetospora aeridis TaxID=3129231 RepID=A0ABU8MZ14_9PSEU